MNERIKTHESKEKRNSGIKKSPFHFPEKNYSNSHICPIVPLQIRTHALSISPYRFVTQCLRS